MKFLNIILKSSFKLTFVLGFSSVFAQSGLNLPYSKSNLGEVQQYGSIREIAMGGTGLASPSQLAINRLNASTLVFNPNTSFDFSIYSEYRSSKSATATNSNIEADIADLHFSLPIKALKWQTAIGLKRYSKSNFFNKQSEFFEQDSIYGHVVNYGLGGINKFTWSNGIKVFKNLNLGTDVNYYFGQLQSAKDVYFTGESEDSIGSSQLKNSSYISTRDLYKTYYKTLSTTLSFNYKFTLDSLKTDVMIGGFYDISASSNGLSSYFVNKFNNGALLSSDTVYQDQAAVAFLPQGLGVGIGLKFDNKFIVSVDVKLKKFNNISNNRISVGVERYPTEKNNSMISRSFLWAGAYHNQNALFNGNQGVDEIGINFGIGIPKRDKTSKYEPFSLISTGITIGAHGSTNNGSIKETFVRLNFGMTFNNKWFQVVKIN